MKSKIFFLSIILGFGIEAFGQIKNRDTVLTFFDGQVRYVMVVAEIDGELLEGEKLYTSYIMPDFQFKKWDAFDPYHIDTIRDPDEPAVILALDTFYSFQFHFAQAFPLNFATLKNSTKNVSDLATKQRFEVTQVKYVLFTSEGNVHWIPNLPSEEDIQNAIRIFTTYYITDGKYTFEYPVLFEK